MLLISFVIASSLCNVFHINVIVVEQNIFQVWNIPHSVHPILSYLFQQYWVSIVIQLYAGECRTSVDRTY